MDRRHSHARYTAAWRLACFAGSLGIIYFAVGQLISDGDIGVPGGSSRSHLRDSEALPGGSGGSSSGGGNSNTVTVALDNDAAQQVAAAMIGSPK